MLPPIRVNRHASGTWFRLAENQIRAAIGSCGDVPAVLSPKIQSANDHRTIKTTQPVPAGVQIEALLGHSNRWLSSNLYFRLKLLVFLSGFFTGKKYSCPT
jgi:hypothetical protein